MSSTDDKIVSDAQTLFERSNSHWSTIYSKARDDLFFLSDEPMAQWDPKDYGDRISTGRPALTIDQLGQFIHQVANNIRMNTPSINLVPANSEADVETAEIFKGLIKAIEYDSNAAEVYDTASDFAIRSSVGFIRVDHEYADDDGFDQKLVIKRVINPLACYLDPDSIESDGRDAKYAFVLEQITVQDFKACYPDANVCSFVDNENGAERKDGDYVTIAEFFQLSTSEQLVGINSDGYQEDAIEGQEYTVKRKVQKTTVMRYKLSGEEVLEKTTFPGKYIPIIPVYGEEAWRDGKRYLNSLIRKSKGAQMMYNVWKSLETEILAKQPNAPVQAAEGSTENYAADWKDPTKSMVLRYKRWDSAGRDLGIPERLSPPTVPTGIVNASRETVDDIKATMGIYNASIGQRSNETSGVAINQRKIEGDTATYHFGDNLIRSITQVGRVLVFASPEVYDTARIIQIINGEDEPEQVGINGAMAEEQEKSFDLTKGKYNVRVITGPSFTTRRQEMVSALNDVFKANPQLMSVFGDIYFKNSDFTGAEALASRAEKLLPPQLQDNNQAIPPQAQAQLQQMQQQMQQMGQIIQQGAEELQKTQQQLQNKTQELQVRAQADQSKASNEQDKNMISAMQLKKDSETNQANIDLENRKLDIDELNVAGNLAIGAMQMQLDTLMQSIQRIEGSITPQESGQPGTPDMGSVS